ncbi:hypothetical protein GOODEAATRI_028523, partial [Goodea atripinnis]
FLASLKLPSYEEVAAQPSTPPPPYSSVFTTPRYPQPPRAADPHLLTQHGPLLHRPLSDGPSSFSSDNSSSCSCDSCCPSSPCSSSLSAPITYETDTSHASTPSEATPLNLDVAMETIAAAASCLEANEAKFPSERAGPTVAVDIVGAEHVRAQELPATDSSIPSQTVTMAVVTRAASSQPSPGSEMALTVAPSSPINAQLDMPPCSPIFSTGTITAPVSSPLTQNLEPSPGGSVLIPSSPVSGRSGSVARVVSSVVLTISADNSGPSPGLQESSESNLLAPLPADVQTSFSSGSGSGSPTFIPALTCTVPVNSSPCCPAITIESETSFTSSHSPVAVVSPSSPRSPPCLTAPALLLDPLAALHQPDKGGCSSGHASSLSPSARATQSPPKQTVFSPCVDIFEPGPARWEDGEEEQDDKDKEEDEDDEMGADESQYRHRRLTGDSGIEVCRCQVEEEEDDEEDEEEEKDGNTDPHDSMDCPARSQMSTGDELIPCNPSASVTMSSPEENGKVIIVMEKV